MLFSVIIPSYNASKTLPALLDSLKVQSWRDFETIIVDDFSEDITTEIVHRYGLNLIKLDKNKNYIVIDENNIAKEIIYN